jgi:ribosomal-protein-alanine N-acetyltransferase
MPGATFLEGDRVELCTIETEDAAFVTEAVNDPAVRVPLGVAEPRNRASHEEWIEEEIPDGDGFDLLVVADGDPIGVLGTPWLSERHGHAYLSAWLAADAHGQGYGADATATFVDFLFDERRMESLRAHAYDMNDKSNALLSSIGFEHVGAVPKAAYVDGEQQAQHVYALTKAQWREKR